MRLDLRTLQRQRLFRIDVDAAARPPVVKAPDGRECFLQWEQAVDDQGYLRRCPACGCRDLFARRDFPQVTAFGLVVLAAIGSVVLVGAHRLGAGLVVLAVVALLDLAIFLFAGRCLVCYQCRSEFRHLPIRREHPRWESGIGERYRQPPGEAAARAPGTPGSPASPGGALPAARKGPSA